MFKKIYIKNFALIEDLEIDLGSGFNVLTGETGAGKSIIIDAVEIITGQAASSELIRSGEDKALLEGIFDPQNNDLALEKLEEYGFLPESGEDLILTRELNRTGKNLCRINGRQVNLSLYREIAETFVDIYGQHHQQSLLNTQKHIDLLDSFGGEEILQLKHHVAEIYDKMAVLKNQISKLRDNEKEIARMADIYKYQYDEIEKSQIEPDKDNALEETRNILANAEKITCLSNDVYEILYDGGSYKSVIDLLYQALSNMKELVSFDSSLGSVYKCVEDALIQLEEAAREIKAFSTGVEHDPDRLDQIENRLELLNRLKKKYGDTLEDIIKYKEQIASSIDNYSNHDEALNKLESELLIEKGKYEDHAAKLKNIRLKLAAIITEKITAELKQLSMPHVTLQISIQDKPSPSRDGLNQVEFLISPNKGEPLKSLAKIVSGGEMSRIMLAFKSILAQYDHISTLIFDEVDAGIGGIALKAVAGKLAHIGQNKQVICVTHSPQLAGCASHHFNIRKTVYNERTRTTVHCLSYQERVQEIARMLSGDKISEVAKNHAIEILSQFQN